MVKGGGKFVILWVIRQKQNVNKFSFVHAKKKSY